MAFPRRFLLPAILALLPPILRGDCVVVFNEVMYHPPAPDAATEMQREWIEIHNQMAVDIDLSGWRLSRGVDYFFPAGTIIRGGAYLVIAAAPAAFQALTGVSGALGPWTGQLSNDGETIELRNNNDRVMDSLHYGTEGKWPSAPDGAGATLTKKARDVATDDPLSWRSSRALGGTPGAENFPAFLPPISRTLVAIGEMWKYKADGIDQNTPWRTESFSDADWNEGAAAFNLGANSLPTPAVSRTSLPLGPTTYYFRRHFPFTGRAAATTLQLKLLIDDGAAMYLNGSELVRPNIAPGVIGYNTAATNPRRGAVSFQEFTIPGMLLHSGDNLVAVELHQAATLPAYADAIISAGPVAYWRLDETANSIADLADLRAAPESGSQAGTFQGFLPGNLGAPGPRPSDGLPGFDVANTAPAFQGNSDGGDDVATFPDDGTLNFAAGRQFSVEAWVKGSPTQEDGAPIFCKGTGGGGEQFSLDIVGGRFRFYVRNGAAAAVVAQSNVAPNNSWQHVAVIFDQPAAIMRLYVNGTLAVSAAPPSTLLNTTHEVSVGARKGTTAPSYNLNFNGTVDEVAIFNRALSAAEISAHYSAAFTANTPGVDVTDAVFAAELVALETQAAVSRPTLAFNEISTTTLELMNFGSVPLDLGGYAVFRIGGGGSASTPLPAQALAPGQFLQLAFSSLAGDRLLLVAPDAATIIDSTEAKATPRARKPDGDGDWIRPSAATFGASNSFNLHDEIVINEIMYDHPSSTLFPPGTARAGQWIELHNRSSGAVDLSGWQLEGGVSFGFPNGTIMPAGGYLVVAENPAALAAAHGLAPSLVVGPWSGNLSHSHDRVVLSDPSENPADEVTFYSGGRWPEAANAGGSSLELRDVQANNNRAEAWAASDESGKSAWQTFTWRGANNPSQGGEPTLWHELNLLLIDGPGECLIDDVRVTDTVTNAELVQNGSFDAALLHWRVLGTHRGSRVEPEPGNPGNNVLHLVATGPGEYQGNQIETTFASNQALVAGRQYEISLKARWLSGGARLNTRAYFNRIPKTNLLTITSTGGTPGAINSRVTPNIGPTFDGLSHSPLIPLPGEAVTVSVEADDPQGIAALDLKYSIAGGPWQTAPMSLAGESRYSATIAGAAGATIVQFYIEGRDSAGAISVFPSGGANSRALYQVDNGAPAGPLPQLRLLMTIADATFLHAPVNTLSNATVGATIIEHDQVYYDVGARLKGSFVGRNVPRVGFNVRFNDDHPFRGVLDKIAIDRSMHTAVNNPAEIIIKHIANEAGGIPSMYDDIVRFIHPLSTYTGVASMRLAAFEEEYLDSQFPNGGDGTMFEFEVLRWALSTIDNNPESLKQPGNEGSGTGYANLELTGYGNDKEAYRWNALATMHRDQDDYARMIALDKMFALSGTAFDVAARQQLDLEEWLRALAFQSLVGPGDAVFTGGNIHNFRLFFRPHDGLAMYMPWDWDSAFQRAPNASLVGGGNIAKVVTVRPDNTRRYYAHLYDIISTTFNSNYMSRWTQHYGVLAGQDYSGYLNYITQRAAFVLSQLPTGTAFAATPGSVTSNGAVTVTGNANIQVDSIEVNGLAYSPTWSSTTAWSILVPLASGSNTLILRGLDKHGNPVSNAESTVVVTNPNDSGWPTLRINEWLAQNDNAALDPADDDTDDWFEIYNPTLQPVDLSGWKISDSVSTPGLFVVPNGWSIPPGGYLLVWADNEPAQNSATPTSGSHLHVNFKLDEGGQTLLLTAPDNREIDRVAFGEQASDESEGRYADGGIGAARLTVPTPGGANVLARYSNLDFATASPSITVTTTPGWVYQLETSTDLVNWAPASDPVIAASNALTFPVTNSGANRFFHIRLSR